MLEAVGGKRERERERGRERGRGDILRFVASARASEIVLATFAVFYFYLGTTSVEV